MNKLQDKTAIVTGAGRGVGQAAAIKLSEEGAAVVVNDLDEPAVIETVTRIQAMGGRAIGLPGDVTDIDFPSELIETAVASTGQIDIVVNNAGYIWNSAIHNHSDDQWQAMLDIHATAPFRILRAFAPWLRDTARREIAESGRARCRKVVNVSSVSGTRGSATQIGYSAGKAAVIGITRTLAKEWGRYNVTVNCVAFGHINTRLTQPYEDEPPTIDVAGKDFRVGLNMEQIRAIESETPLGRAGEPEDGAGAIYLFCIPESDFISGEVLTCSGGL